MWRGLAHGEVERCTIPSRSSCSNSALAALLAMGGPFVEMKCSTPCDEGGSTLDALATLWKLVQDDAAQGPRRQGDKPGPRWGLVSGDGGHSPGRLAALAATRLRGGGWIRDVNLLCGGTPDRCGSGHRRGLGWFGLAAHAGYSRQLNLHHTVKYSCAIYLYSSSPHQEVKI
jgi:hypothetical protein